MLRTAVFAFFALSTLSFQTAAQNAGKAAEIYNKGLELQQSGDAENALAAYDRAIALNPKMLDAYNNRATIKLAAGDSAGAIADLTKVIELSPKHPLSFYNRGCIYLDMQNMDPAIDDFSKAIEIFDGVTHGEYDKKHSDVVQQSRECTYVERESQRSPRRLREVSDDHSRWF